MDHLCYLCHVCHAFVSVHGCLLVTYRERDGILAAVCDVILCIPFPFDVLGKV